MVTVRTVGFDDASTTRTPRGDDRRPQHIFPRQRIDRGVEGRLAVAPGRAGCAPFCATPEGRRDPGRGVVIMFGFFHMAGWYFLEHAWRRIVPCTSSPDPAHRAALRRRALARAGSIASPGCGNAFSTTGARTTPRRSARCSPVRHASTLGLVRRVQGAFPRFLDVGRLRLDRDRCAARCSLDSRPRRGKPGSVGSAAARGRGGDLADDGELLQRGPRRCSPATWIDPTLPRRRSTARAGTTPETSLRRTTTGTSPSSAGAPRASVRACAKRIAPVEVESGDPPRTRRWRMSAVVGLPDGDRWGELVCAVIVVRPGATPPSVDELRSASHVAPGWSGPSIRGSS